MNKPNIKMAISELHSAFHMLNNELFKGELPEPAILIQSKGNRKNVLGWCSVHQVWENNKDGDKRWEINIVSESLNRSLEDIMCTLLHEMVHLHNLVKGVQDTSRSGTYHNKRFKEAAEQHGLIITYHDQIGWSLSELNPVAKTLISVHGINPNAFNLSKIDFDLLDDGEEGTRRKSSSRKWVCPKCGTIIRSTKEVRVICADCDVLFINVDPDEEAAVGDTIEDD